MSGFFNIGASILWKAAMAAVKHRMLRQILRYTPARPSPGSCS
jgi:hypothetical protein